MLSIQQYSFKVRPVPLVSMILDTKVSLAVQFSNNIFGTYLAVNILFHIGTIVMLLVSAPVFRVQDKIAKYRSTMPSIKDINSLSSIVFMDENYDIFDTTSLQSAILRSKRLSPIRIETFEKIFKKRYVYLSLDEETTLSSGEDVMMLTLFSNKSCNDRDTPLYSIHVRKDGSYFVKRYMHDTIVNHGLYNYTLPYSILIYLNDAEGISPVHIKQVSPRNVIQSFTRRPRCGM